MTLPVSRIRAWFLGLSGLNRRRVVVAAVLGLLLAGTCVILNNTSQPWEGKAAKYLEDYQEGRRKRLPTEYFIQVYLWKAGALNAGLLAALLVTSPLWVGWLSDAGGTRKPAAAVRPSRRGWILFGAALLVAVSVRLPKMERSLLFDEQDNLRRSFHGYVDVTDEGEKWMGASWGDTFFENRQGNNPALFGVLARLSMDSWRAATGGAPDTFNLWMMRLPSLLSGVFLMLVVWRFLHFLGSPNTALVAVFLLALHPMAIDYHAQARGYGLVMLFASVAAVSAYRGLREPGWRPWIAYGLSQVAMLWSYPGSLYFALAMNGFLGVYFLVGWLRRGERAPLVRFVLVNVVSAMVFLQVMLPVLVQAKAFLDKKFGRGELGLDWAFSIGSAYLGGGALPEQEWWYASPPEERDIGAYIVEHYLPEHPLGAALVFFVIPVLVAAGLERLRRTDRPALLVAGAGLAAPVAAFVHHHYFTGLWVYYWYLIYLLPFLCILAAVGWSAVAGRRPSLACGLSAAFLVFFGFAVGTPKPALPGAVYKSRPEVEEIKRPGYVYRITKAGRMTREADGG